MKVALLASEVVPYAKTGGLADVTGSLPKFLAALGVEVKVVLPLYRETRQKGFPLVPAKREIELNWGQGKERFSVFEHALPDRSVIFIENDAYFDRDHLYGTARGDDPDNGERFAFFSRASLEALRALGFRPDIIHAHDWQAALSLAYLKHSLAGDPFFSHTRSLFTIHNLAYQGLFEKDILARVGLPEHLFNMEDLEFYGRVNYLKAGILYSTAINTVSRRYSQEIQTPEFGYRLDGLLRKRREVLFGILNGVDYSAWNPATDRFIARPFDPTYIEGKKACRADLLRQFSLDRIDEETPVVGMVSRLAGQKGFDILCQALDSLFELGVALVILGTGEDTYQRMLLEARERHPDALGLTIAFDEALSHKIYAGCDMFLIPSRYEPCGLTQMYSLRYGTIPIVRATGGLDDTIQEYDWKNEVGNGFKFEPYSPVALIEAVKNALGVYRQRDRWKKLVRRAMTYDFSWDRSAREYLRLYNRIMTL